MTVQEIIYTSAQKGLKPGSSGFCTVVCTAGIDQRTASRLEGLSGYRHPFEINDPRNPVNFQHITMRVGAANTHVMSRVCDAGPDHTGRTNKLAHHIAFTQPPSPSGPARLFKSPGLFASQWDGKTSQRAAPTLPSVPLAAVTLSAWAALTKDGGWAGHLAEQLVSSKQPVYVLFPAGTDTLSLLTEVLDVVPASRRWAVTFSTYYTNPIAGAECQLRFVLDGTKDATKLKNDARAVIVDLTTPLPKATGGELVPLARSGVVPQTVVAAKKKPQPKPGSSKPSSGKPAESIDDDWMEPEADDFSSVATSGVLSPPQVGAGSTRPQAPNLFGAQRALKEQRLVAAGRRSGKGKIVTLILGVVLLLVGVSAGVWFAISDADGDRENTRLLAESAKAREATEREDKRKAAEARAKEKQEQQIIQDKKRADDLAKKEKQDAAAAAKLAKQKQAEKEQEAAELAELEKQKEAEKAARSKPIDIFGQPIADGVAETEPVVRIIEWGEQDPRVTIPVAKGATFELLLHHQTENYTVETITDSRKWTVRGGIEPLRIPVVNINRAAEGNLELSRIGIEKSLPSAVLQITSKNKKQCGFVMFQQPELFKAIPLKKILSAETKVLPYVMSSRKIDTSAMKRVRLLDGNEIVEEEIVKLVKDAQKAPRRCDVQQAVGKKTEFKFCGGPIGAEHRHVIGIQYAGRGSEVTYRLEFAKRASIPEPSPWPVERPRSQLPIRWTVEEEGARVFRQRKQWLNTQMTSLVKSHSEREWKRFERGNSKSQAKKLAQTLSRIEKGPENFLTLNQKLSPPDREIEGVLNDFIEAFNKNRKSKTHFTTWEDLKALVEDIEERPVAAKKSKDELIRYKLHYSVFHPIPGTVSLPNSLKQYRMQVPVLEFSDRKSRDRLGWRDILFEVDDQSPIEQSSK